MLNVIDKIAYIPFDFHLFRKFLPSFHKSVMIKIRLQRHGARHAPFYRLVVATSTVRRDGRFIEVLGTYNPQAHARTEELKLKMDRIDHWLGVGAQPTDTAKSLISQGRLSPEEWLERADKKATAKLARTKKSNALVMEESSAKESPAEEPEAKSEEPAEAKRAEAVEEAPAEEPAVEEESPAEEPEAKSEKDSGEEDKEEDPKES